jgi:hypothetical protein
MRAVGFTQTCATCSGWTPRLSVCTLLRSGLGDHLLHLELSACGINDQGLSLLSEALVGSALYLRYLSLSFNPIGDEGVIAFSGVLARRRGLALMLPLLRWLHLGLGDAFTDEGAISLADSLRDSVLPSLQVLWCFGGFSSANSGADGELVGEQAGELVGVAAIQSACGAMDIAFEGLEGPAGVW